MWEEAERSRAGLGNAVLRPSGCCMVDGLQPKRPEKKLWVLQASRAHVHSLQRCRAGRAGWEGSKRKRGPRDPQALAAVSSDMVLVGPPGGSQVETWICQSHGGSEGLVGGGGACLPLAGSGSARLEGCDTQVGSVLSVQPDPRVPWCLAPACVLGSWWAGPWRPEGSGMGAPLRIDPGQLLARGLLSDGPLDLLKKQNGKVTACRCSGSSACDELRTTRPHRDPWGYHQAWLPCCVWVLNQLFSCPPFPAGEQVAPGSSGPVQTRHTAGP